MTHSLLTTVSEQTKKLKKKSNLFSCFGHIRANNYETTVVTTWLGVNAQVFRCERCLLS